MMRQEILRPAAQEDGPDWHRWRNEGRDAFIDGLPFSLGSHRQWFEAKLGDAGSRLWTVIHEGRAVGMVGLAHVDHRQQSAELAWVYIEPAARGLGTAAVRAVLSMGFRELNLHRIYLTVLADNTRAIRCYQKAGLQEEGRLREAVFKGGERRDLVLMAILRPEFETMAREMDPDAASS